MVHGVAALDGVFPEVSASDPPDRLRAAVVAARGHLGQVGSTLLNVERSLGRIEALASIQDTVEAEVPR